MPDPIGRAGISGFPLVAVRKDVGLTCRDKDNCNRTPLCIPRAPLGTHERFIGGSQAPASSRWRLHAGNFPLWLAPDQVRVITLNDDQALIDYAQPIVNELRANMVRVDADFSATPQQRSAEHCSAYFCSHPPTNRNWRSNASRSGSSSAAATSARSI